MSYMPPPGPPGPPDPYQPYPQYSQHPQRPPSSGRTGLLIAIVVALVAIAGVGAAIAMQQSDDSPEDERQAYVEAMMAVATAADMGTTETEVRCLADGAIDILGLDALRAIATPEELLADPDQGLTDRGLQITPAQGEQLYGVMDTCIGVREAWQRALSVDYPDIADCVVEAFSDELLKRSFIANQVDGEDYMETNPEIAADVEAIVEVCS